MTGGAKNKTDAATFLAYMTNPKAQSALAAGLGELPVLKDAAAASPALAAQATLLSTIPHFAQFFDRDTTPRMADVGMQQFQRLLYDPTQIDTIIAALTAQQKEESEGD